VTTYAPQSHDPKAPLWAVTGSHLAGALVTLKDAVNAHWPRRDHASDGFIGDDRHVAEGSGSDHNPWLNHTVRAGDFDKDGIDADWFAEQLRLLGAAGDPRLAGGGYVIWNGRITKPDFSGWVDYHGDDDHSGHVHVSLSRNPAGYEDNRTPWSFFAGTAPQPAAQPQHPGRVWAPGKDATGADAGFRAHIGDEGPKIQELQHELNDFAPAYSHLEEDGVYGPQTAAVLDEFSERAAHEPQTPAGDRQALVASDGRDVGPRTARALDRHGLI
jgi:hypothetical protein